MANEIYEIPVKKIDGSDASLNDYRGKVLLVVNVASKCGLTPQYAGLESLYKEYRDQGLEVLAFPANNFLAQEPGTSDEIADFCQMNYDVTFPLFQKISVKGKDQHLLYHYLTEERGEADITEGDAFEEKLAGFGQKRENAIDVLWNFEKFLIAKDGTVAARIAPDVTAENDRLVAAVKAELAK